MHEVGQLLVGFGLRHQVKVSWHRAEIQQRNRPLIERFAQDPDEAIVVGRGFKQLTTARAPVHHVEHHSRHSVPFSTRHNEGAAANGMPSAVVIAVLQNLPPAPAADRNFLN